ncbi:hypothetical protein POM88_035382 [Heracleum sosnowskyi]|uniref:RNase H type-1 domain-containing protein n=1 Tax=Heracleum sosnowskyi TaxID=360622 RepID=A0AAD8HL75_9APIA|nr:hypothetical protein POM88_035382 [Heracleum sosnowskyi]
MEVAWFAPEDDFVKLNMFVVDVTLALANGNCNGVGIIMRDTEGQMLWAAMGPMNNKSKDEAELRALHSGMVWAVNMKRLKINIETSNMRVYDTIRFQEFIFLEDEFVQVMKLINTLHANNFKDDTSVVRFSFISQELKGTAAFLANYGMEKVPSFALIPEVFDTLKERLDYDMGLAVIDIAPNFREGEIVNAPNLSLLSNVAEHNGGMADEDLSSGRMRKEYVMFVKRRWSICLSRCFLILQSEGCECCF